MPSPPRWPAIPLTALLCCWLASALPPQAGAQVTPDTERAPSVSADEVRGRLQAIEGNTTLDEAVKNRIVEVYRQVLTDLDAGKSMRDVRQQWLEGKSQAAQKLADLNRELATAPAVIPPPDASQLTQLQLDQKVAELQAALAEAQAKLASLKAEPKRRSDRRLEVPKQTANLAGIRTELEGRLAAEAARTDLPPEQREAEKLGLDVKLQNVELELQRMRDELAYYDATDELLSRQIQREEQRVERAAAEASAWVAEAERKRRESAAKDVQEKERKAGDVPAELQALADGNLQLSEKLRDVVGKIEEVNQQVASTQAQATLWSEQLTRARTLIDVQAGVSESVGNLLRQQRRDLPDLRHLRQESHRSRETLYNVRSDEFTTGEQLAEFTDFQQRVDSELKSLSQRMAPARVTELEPEVRLLLEARQKTLQELQRNYKTYKDKLVAFGIQQEVLTTLVDEYTTYIDQRILWIRSVPPLEFNDLLSVPAGLRRLSSADVWRGFWPALVREVRARSLQHVALALLLVICLAYRTRGRSEIRRLGEQAAAKGCRNFRITIQAFLWTLVVSAAGPVLLLWIAWTLSSVADNDTTAMALPLAGAAWQATFRYWPLSIWRSVVRPKGLAEAHFGWTPAVLKLVRRHLRWFVPTVVVLVAAFYFFGSLNNPLLERSLGRLSALAICLSNAVFLRYMLSPQIGVPREFLAQHKDGWLSRLQFVWFPLLLAVPLSLACLTVLGYQYTAARLTDCLFSSGVYLSGLYLVEAILGRWILVNRRRLAIAQAKERLLTGGPAPGERDRGEFFGGVTENTQVDLTEVNAQTRRLLNVFVFAAAAIGLYLIWIDSLPALARMNEVHLWRYDDTLPVAPAAAGSAAASTGPAVSNPMANIVAAPTATTNGAASAPASQGWITLGHLVSSLLLLGLTYVAVRNIPGLLEIAILQHLPLDASVRFAITTVTRYALIIAGTAWAFTNIGFGWSKIQWLAAAVVVGLGFGLQEIFANFVSGLILLFERPLRVGDIVTVGGTTGTVVQIRTRATTIRDWDRKELIVPNKEFITNQLLNWTLTDETNRVVLSVGVAYGSDIRRAREIISNVVTAHSLVMSDPAPTVTLDHLGDSALNFTVRCVLARMEDRLPVIHELHTAIHDQLAAAGISIPFPQRDVHLHVRAAGAELPLVVPPRLSQ